MKVLVTGGVGYIGSHVLKSLLESGFDVIVLDNLQKGHEKALLGGTFIQGDLSDVEILEEIFSQHKIDGVIHLAADSLVGESMDNPSKYYRNNVLNGFQLLETMHRYGVKCIVFSSTAAVYGEPKHTPITEDHPTCPTSVYGRTKLHFEEMLEDYDKAYGIRFVSLRYFNAAGADPSGKIGEDHNPETHLIPIVLQTALGLRRELKIFGTDYNTKDGTCIRDYIHVSDLANAHILALEALIRGNESKIYNLGNGMGYSVREVIETASKVVKKPIPATKHPRRPGDPAVLIASSEKIKKELGWKVQYPDLQSIIETAWKWHQSHPRGFQ